MKLARYVSGGIVAIVDEPTPACPPGGLLIRTEASGLCSGELMDWYMEAKAPHVLGHEVAGIVVESQDPRFPVGVRVAPHHHAPCFECAECRRGAYVHCPQWKRTRLVPGGMAEAFAVPSENLGDTLVAPNMRSVDAALTEPLACVCKSIRRSGLESGRVAVIGLGAMGVMHVLALRHRHVDAIGYEVNPLRAERAVGLNIDVRHPDQRAVADVVFVCPGTEAALRLAIELVAPAGTIVLFSPLGPPGSLQLDIDRLYFADVSLVASYSAGPDDFAEAHRLLVEGAFRAEHFVSHFIGIDELPEAYQAMKRGEILKPMVQFGTAGTIQG